MDTTAVGKDIIYPFIRWRKEKTASMWDLFKVVEFGVFSANRKDHEEDCINIFIQKRPEKTEASLPVQLNLLQQFILYFFPVIHSFISGNIRIMMSIIK